MKNINFVPKDVQRILSLDKILEKYNEEKVFFKRNVHNNFAILTGKYLRISFLIKIKGLQLYQKETTTQVFSW